jgi:hypothetical protein
MAMVMRTAAQELVPAPPQATTAVAALLAAVTAAPAPTQAQVGAHPPRTLAQALPMIVGVARLSQLSATSAQHHPWLR